MMTASVWLLIALIALLIVLSAFLSGSETALTAVSRARMHSLEKAGNSRAALVNRLIDRRDRLIGALLIGNNLVNILASAIATSLFLRWFGEPGIAIATLVMTTLVVIFAEVLPKSWAIASADRFAMVVVPFVQVVVTILLLPTLAVTAIVRGILRLIGVNTEAGQYLLSAHEEIRGAVEVLHQEGSVIKVDKDRLGGLLDLGEMDVSDVMVHRTKMYSVNADDPPEELVNKILESPYTRLPVWKQENENIIGIVHSKDLLRQLATIGHDVGKLDIMRIVTAPWFVPESTNLKSQLNAFLRRKAHIALVVDEYGEVEGLVTLEDILEEIVGDIADEHDIDLPGVVSQADGSVLVEGSVPIRDVNRALEWELPDDEATTIAGLVIHEAQMIPEEKQSFTFYNKRFLIVQREKNRLTQIRIRGLKG